MQRPRHSTFLVIVQAEIVCLVVIQNVVLCVIDKNLNVKVVRVALKYLRRSVRRPTMRWPRRPLLHSLHCLQLWWSKKHKPGSWSWLRGGTWQVWSKNTWRLLLEWIRSELLCLICHCTKFTLRYSFLLSLSLSFTYSIRERYVNMVAVPVYNVTAWFTWGGVTVCLLGPERIRFLIEARNRLSWPWIRTNNTLVRIYLLHCSVGLELQQSCE